VPELYEDRQLMMKCDMCYDRTTVGKKPMCATVCPSQALFFGTREQILALRPQSMPTNRFQFGRQTITTRVNVMVPRRPRTPPLVDVTSALDEKPQSRSLRLPMVGAAHLRAPPVAGEASSSDAHPDPFAEVEV
jgi:Fe-S-cluster-containing dehydrogenase component